MIVLVTAKIANIFPLTKFANIPFHIFMIENYITKTLNV